MSSPGDVDFLVTGAGGQLGRALLDEAGRVGAVAIGAAHGELAVEDASSVRSWVERYRPSFVIHCAAWTDVDGCERDPHRANRVNVEGTSHVAHACAEAGVGLVYPSTDFVFDGSKREPYRIDDAPHPLSVYGRSKESGEHSVLAAGRPDFYVVRTSWVFGPGGRNFPRAILERARRNLPLAVVDDQVGSPTLTRDLAQVLIELARSAAPGGIYHAANDGNCSWHRFAVEILERAGMDATPVARLSSAEVERPAPRPAYSVLDCSLLTALRGHPLPHYLDALDRYMSEELA